VEDLSLHVLDVAENAIRAGADCICIRIREDLAEDLLLIEIEDNGPGMDEETVRKAVDPFFTTRTTRKVGMGLALLAESARMAEGDMEVKSEKGRGTVVRAWFRHGHIDRRPMGDMAGTITALAACGREVRIRYEHQRDGKRFCVDTDTLKREVAPVPLFNPEVLLWLREYVREGLKEIGAFHSH
jgi:anti-sigma regulatory factor (Ser/Thr protein kinase)